MDRADQEKAYRELMGEEAANRQIELGSKCPACGEPTGRPHKRTCRFSPFMTGKRRWTRRS